MSDSLIGKPGRMTASATHTRCGEVMLSVRQGTEAYFAFAADHDVIIATGAQVLVVDEGPGRTVYVTPQ